MINFSEKYLVESDDVQYCLDKYSFIKDFLVKRYEKLLETSKRLTNSEFLEEYPKYIGVEYDHYGTKMFITLKKLQKDDVCFTISYIS